MVKKEATEKADKQEPKKRSKRIANMNKNKLKQDPKDSSTNKESSTEKLNIVKKEENLDFQYDENGNPYKEIGGFIVWYEDKNSDSDSTIDDTEFFRRVHEEIRNKKALGNNNNA